MANDVSLRPLGDLIVSYDHLREPVRESDRRTGPYPYYGASGIVDRVDSYRFDGDYLLIAEDGENLRTQQTPIAFLASGQFWVNNHAHVVQANQTSDTRYLMYALRSVEVRAYLTGSTMPKLTAGNLARITIPFRPLPEQRAIADILGALDDKIEFNRKMSATLEAIARALFKSWFVDFDPVRAKAEGRDPGLPPELAALFPDSFEDSELGEIPKGWRVGGLTELATILSGGTPQTGNPEYWSGQILWASAKDVSRAMSPFLVKTERSITERGLSESATQIIPRFSTVIVARGATTGRMTLLGRDMAMNQTCYALVSKSRTPFTLSHVLRGKISDLVRAAHGSVFDTITTSTFLQARDVVAPTNIMESFEALAAPMHLRILTGVQQSQTLTEIRDASLPKLISGDIRVSDAERLVEQSA